MKGGRIKLRRESRCGAPADRRSHAAGCFRARASLAPPGSRSRSQRLYSPPTVVAMAAHQLDMIEAIERRLEGARRASPNRPAAPARRAALARSLRIACVSSGDGCVHALRRASALSGGAIAGEILQMAFADQRGAIAGIAQADRQRSPPRATAECRCCARRAPTACARSSGWRGSACRPGWRHRSGRRRCRARRCGRCAACWTTGWP